MKDIDLVYMWVNGNDPAWKAKRKIYVKDEADNTEINCEGRYVDNDELRYSLRAVAMYAPWIRRLFIVTDNQKPEWLDTTNPKIQIVDHSEIMPEESRPCFNSSLIEHFLYRIPGLSEHFLFSNDDMFINKEVKPSDFFTSDGLPIVRLTRKPLRRLRWFWRVNVRKKPLQNYRLKVVRSSELVNKTYGKYYNGMPHHNIDGYLRSDYQRLVEVVYAKEFAANNGHRMRNDDDVHRSVFSYAALAEKRGVLRYVDGHESMYLNIHKRVHFELLDQRNPMFFCLNDSQVATNDDRAFVRQYLTKRFPEKSEFEK